MDILNQIIRTSCQFCFFDHTDPRKVIIHMLVKHQGDACLTVKCVVANCMYMTKTWTAYRQHCKCKHNINMNRNTLGVFQHELIENNDTEGDEVQNDPRHNNNTYFCDQMITAKFILSLEAAHKVSSTALNTIVFSTGSIMSEMLQKLSMRVLSIQRIEGFHENIQVVFSQSNEIQCFKDLQTHQHRCTFYKEHFLLIPPEKCLLGSKYLKCQGE